MSEPLPFEEGMEQAERRAVEQESAPPAVIEPREIEEARVLTQYAQERHLARQMVVLAGSQQRADFKQFVKDNFVEGVHYALLPNTKKRSILIAGAELVHNGFLLRPHFEPDYDAWKMLGSPNGVVCWICQLLFQPTGDLVGEGRGVCSNAEGGAQGRDIGWISNKTVKKAQIRAVRDVVIRVFGMHEFDYTQDEIEENGKQKTEVKPTPQKPERDEAAPQVTANPTIEERMQELWHKFLHHMRTDGGKPDYKPTPEAFETFCNWAKSIVEVPLETLQQRPSAEWEAEWVDKLEAWERVHHFSGRGGQSDDG